MDGGSVGRITTAVMDVSMHHGRALGRWLCYPTTYPCVQPHRCVVDVLFVAVKARRSSREGVLCPVKRSCYGIILPTQSRGRSKEVRGELFGPGLDEWETWL